MVRGDVRRAGIMRVTTAAAGTAGCGAGPDASGASAGFSASGVALANIERLCRREFLDRDARKLQHTR
jgi:hypothetical protein